MSGVMRVPGVEQRLGATLRARTSSFVALTTIGRLDPAQSFKGKDLSNVDFGSDDLAGYNFTAADLRGAKFAGARNLEQVTFDAALVDYRTTGLAGLTRYDRRASDAGLTLHNVALEPGALDLDSIMAAMRLNNNTADYVDVVGRAYEALVAACGNATRSDGMSFLMHATAVAAHLAKRRMDALTVVTGLLHGAFIDSRISQASVEATFGSAVSLNLVKNRTMRSSGLSSVDLSVDAEAEKLRRLIMRVSRGGAALHVELIARLVEARNLDGVADASARRRVAEEAMFLYAPIASQAAMPEVAYELQDRCFAEANPDSWKIIRGKLTAWRGGVEKTAFLHSVRQRLLSSCEGAGVEPVSISGQELSPFLIWKRMLDQSVAFEQIQDILSLYVVVGEKADCYRALGAIHQMFPAIADRFMDFTHDPVGVGCRGIRTGIKVVGRTSIDLHIRTVEMVEPVKPPFSEDSGRAGVVSPLPDAKQDEIFCFTPKGELVFLPIHATLVDFAYAVHSQVGDTCVGAKVNGRLLPLRTELQNGDQVEVMTARGGSPSPGWEPFAVTEKARAAIRRHVGLQERHQALDAGRPLLAKAFRQDGVDGSEKVLETTLKAMKCAALDDLYVAVGNGNIEPKDVVHAAYPELRQASRAPRMLPQMPSRAPSRSVGRAGAAISGLLPNMVVNYAGCCHPLPGDPIVGIVTTGKGVTVHAKSCQTLESFAATPERFLDVGWEGDGVAGGVYTGSISLIAGNDPSMLASLTNVISKHEGVVTNLKIVNRQQDFFEILVDVEVRDLRHLSTVIAGLRVASGITQVERARPG